MMGSVGATQAVYYKTGTFAGTPAGCPRDAGRPGDFQKFNVIFSYVPFLLNSHKN